MVLKRCAIKIVICSFWLDISLMVFVISSSVKLSKALVASSKISKWGLRSNARAIDKRCFSPPLNFKPPSPIIVSKPFSALANKLVQLALANTSVNNSLLAVGFTNNKFSFMVPLNKLVSCVTKPI